MKYCIRDWGDGRQRLYEKLGGDHHYLLASKCDGVWILSSGRGTWLLYNGPRDITKEEAAMILFQCGETA